MALATAVAASVLIGASDTVVEVGTRFAVVALLSLIAAVVLGWSSLIPVSLVFLGAAYAVQLGVDDASLDVKAPLLGVSLLLTAELAYWSLEERAVVQSDEGDSLRQLGVLAVLGLAALAAGGVLLAAADLTRLHGLASDLLGATAAAAAVLVIFVAGRAQAREGK